MNYLFQPSNIAAVSLGLLCFAAPATAADIWTSPNTYVGNSADQVVFSHFGNFNTNVAGTAHEDALGWYVSFVYAQQQIADNGKPYSSKQMEGSINCSANHLRVNGQVGYSDKFHPGDIYYEGAPGLSDPISIEPGTLGADLRKYMCGY